MGVVVFVFGLTGMVPLSICSICLLLLWLETSFGICMGCKMYNALYSLGVLKNRTQACPGSVCELPKK